MFGRRRREEEAAAREAERRALFAELAARPDTVCPFLGMAEARVEYNDGVSDAHRCYAFGDPAELSAEQQEKVCLQRGYGNCPRYLRGVLVIPTEELEALRRPQPPVPMLVPPPRFEAPVRSRRRGGLIAVLAVLIVLVAGGGAAALFLGREVPSSAAAAALPGGTGIEAELLSLSEPDGDSQALRATVAIGEASAVANTSLVYVFDISASTRRGGGCGGDQNGDGRSDTSLDCEIAAAAALNSRAIDNGTVAEVGLIGFASGAAIADVGEAAGIQSRIGPDVDEDGDGVEDVVEAMQSANARAQGEPVGFAVHALATAQAGATTFSAGIEAACELLADSEYPNRVVVFLSDGVNRGGEPVSSVLPCDPTVVFNSFAAGDQASCLTDPGLGALQAIADLTGGSCTNVRDLEQLPDILQEVVTAQLVRIELMVDGGEPVDVSASASETLPATGPRTIEVNYDMPRLPEGDHELCLTVSGTDAGGQGSVRSCATVGSGGGALTSTGG